MFDIDFKILITSCNLFASMILKNLDLKAYLRKLLKFILTFIRL